eukprot:15348831-Ditylum_brightwellii.AAC.1
MLIGKADYIEAWYKCTLGEMFAAKTMYIEIWTLFTMPTPMKLIIKCCHIITFASILAQLKV